MAQGSSLSDEELERLGVTRTRDKYGKILYAIPCAICGMTTHSRQYSTSRIYKCRLCKEEIVKKRDAKVKAAREQVDSILAWECGSDYEHYHRFEKGTEKFGDEYSNSIEIAKKAINKFDSVPEVMACIELLHIGARVIVHQKVGSFTVDFCLPDERVVVEIDGSLYHRNRAKQDNRDHAIAYMLEGDWIVKHVPADSVAKKHVEFGQSMRKLLNARRREAGMDRLKHR